jgi:GntR family transcriptional regulator, rspAB operon transcriptional repressor
MARAGSALQARRSPAGSGLHPEPLGTPPRQIPGLAIQRESLEEQVYARLRASIASREFRPGERIPVDRLAADLGISRTPILNALKRLAQERVVDCLSRRGIYVRRFSKREMARLFEVREALEGMGVRLAAHRITPGEVRRLGALFRGLEGPPTAPRVRRYIEQDRRFHRCLMELAGNEQLVAALNSVNMMFFVYQDGVVRPPAETIPEHRAILEALERHDPAASEAAMRVHIRRSIQRLEAEAEAEEARAAEVQGEARQGGRTRNRTPDRPAGARRGNAGGGKHHGTAAR